MSAAELAHLLRPDRSTVEYAPLVASADETVAEEFRRTFGTPVSLKQASVAKEDDDENQAAVEAW